LAEPPDESLIIMPDVGLVLAIGSAFYILRLERQARVRYAELGSIAANCSSFPPGWWMHKRQNAVRFRGLHDEVDKRSDCCSWR